MYGADIISEIKVVICFNTILCVNSNQTEFTYVLL